MKLTRLAFLVCAGVLACAAPAQPAQGGGDDRAGLNRATSVPRLVKFAGRAGHLGALASRDSADEGGPIAGVSVTFAIYAEQEGGAALWQETQNVALDADGRYNVLLGAASRDGVAVELFASGESRWLGVRVNVPGDAGASEEQARVLLVSVPYALRAADADTLGGRAAGDFVLREELAGWSGIAGVAGGVTPGASDRPRATGGAQGAVSGTGNLDFLPRVVQENSPNPGDAVYGNSQISDDGTNLRITSDDANFSIGSIASTGLFNVTLTTQAARNAFNSTLRLENTAPVTGTVLSAMNLTSADRSAADRDSLQAVRMVYLRNVIATGSANNFDSILTTTAFLNSNAPYTLRGVNMEFPRIAAGTQLDTYYGLFLEGPPGGNGSIPNAFALVTQPGSGNVGIGTTAPGELLDVVGNGRFAGTVHSTTGGFRFPDSSVQTTAAFGTVTSIATGAGLTGGPIIGSGTISIPNSGVTNAMLQFNSITVNPGAGLTGGGTPALGGNVTLSQNTDALTRVITYLAGCDTCDLLADADDQKTIFFNALGSNLALVDVRCFTDTGSPTINLRRNGTSNDVLAGNLSCNGSPTSGFNSNENMLAPGDRLDFELAANGGAKRVTVIIRATL